MLASLGIVPVTDEVLEAHKQREIDKHPPSLFYIRPHLHRLMLFLSGVGTVFSVNLLTTFAPLHPAWTGVMAILPCACAVLLMKLVFFQTVKGPACWIEKPMQQPELAQMPTPLIGLVERVRHAAPTLKFTIGTLYQDVTALDPYVSVQGYDSATNMTVRACLGIWDGQKIIEMAQTN
jgi:hypothetical protein